MKRIPVYDETAPVVCTIHREEIPERIELIERMRSNLARVDRTDDGLLLHFPVRNDIDDDLRRFVIDEKRCCQFWGFVVEGHDDDLTLQWDGPPAAAELLDQLHVYFEGDEPLTIFSGLL